MNLKTKLMDHQQKAFDKLKDIKACALFMDMGTGKTRTTLEFIEYRLKQGKITNVFWVCPVSCKENLRIDIEKHTNYSVNTIEKYNDELICIIGTESISMSEKIRIKLLNLLKNNPENYLIIDESHMIKNYDTNRTKFINKNLIKLSKYRAILTGTPVTQGIWDLYTQFYFLHPKILGYHSWHSFASNHLEYSDKFPGMIVEAHNTDYITKKINPYVYQVTKDECLNLPNKSYSYRSVYFDEIEEEYYNLIKDYYIEQIDPDRPERI
ncbi:MAG: SNF2-related protein, partial [Halanaerobiales bacterium]